MKKALIILITSIILIGNYSCKEEAVEAGFEDQIDMTIYDYIVENEAEFSSFLSILERGEIDKTLSAYNPNGIGYTLFLPDNPAIDRFIEESSLFSSLEDLLENTEYVRTFSRYHAVNMGINADDFPFGALPEYTLSEDVLTVNFVIETDTSYYKINNQAPVVKPNIELSNGYIHIISSALNPVTFTTYEWLEQNPGYSIFKETIDATGLEELFNISTKGDSVDLRPFTLLMEHDSVFNKGNIYSFDDLEKEISPEDQDYTNPLNPLYNFTVYHCLTERRFLDDFVDVNTNYSTYSEIPLNINGAGLEILINTGKEVFDTIITPPDTVIIDYIGVYYDQSNLITQSGAIHFIDRVLKQYPPSRAIQTFEFYEEPLLDKFREEPGEYIIEDSASMNVIKWTGSDLFFIELAQENSSAWGNDFLFLDGDFTITYQIPKVVQGIYTVLLGANAFDQENALIEMFIDGKNAGGLIDLSMGGSSDSPFSQIELGTIDFIKYETHIIEIRPLIPGRFSWDYIRFEPY